RHDDRGADWRSDWPKICDLGIYSGCCSLCADASLCRSFLDHRAFRYYWFRTGIGLFSDFGLCTGAAPGQYRNGFRSFLRICFWNGGYRIRTARATCRPYEYLLCLLDLFLPSLIRPYRGLSPQSGSAEQGNSKGYQSWESINRKK